jgi:hypothetical protein
MSGFLTGDFNRIGKAGITIGTGKDEEAGVFRAIALDRKKRDRN